MVRIVAIRTTYALHPASYTLNPQPSMLLRAPPPRAAPDSSDEKKVVHVVVRIVAIHTRPVVCPSLKRQAPPAQIDESINPVTRAS